MPSARSSRRVSRRSGAGHEGRSAPTARHLVGAGIEVAAGHSGPPDLSANAFGLRVQLPLNSVIEAEDEIDRDGSGLGHLIGRRGKRFELLDGACEESAELLDR